MADALTDTTDSGDLGDAAAQEPRRFSRQRVSLTASVWLADANGCEERINAFMLSQPRTTFIDDLSMSGLRFVSPAAFPLGSVVGIRLRLGVHSFHMEALVHWQTAQWVSGKRCYGCGAQFVRTPDAPEALTCIAKYLQDLRRREAGGAIRVSSPPPGRAIPANSAPPPAVPEAISESPCPPPATLALQPGKNLWDD